jgi:hypothetical protein
VLAEKGKGRAEQSQMLDEDEQGNAGDNRD